MAIAHHSCSICFDTGSNFTTNCKHHFCNECITSWLLLHNNCPICRKEFYDISEEERDEIEFSEDGEYDEYNENTTVLYYFDNFISPDRDLIEALFMKWFMIQRYIPYSCSDNLMKRKLPKNINMRYRKNLYRFDNTNYNNVATRY